MSDSIDGRMLEPALARELHQVQRGRHYRRLMAFIVLYLAGASGAWMAHRTGSGALAWLAAGPFYLLAAASLHGISLFAHEAVHGTLGARRWSNWLLGAACAIPVLQNCAAYRVLHLRHHSHLREEGDPDHYANYTHWTWLIFAMNWLRLLVGYPVYIVLIPILGFRQGTRADRILIALETFATVGLAAALLVSPLPWSAWLHGWLIPMLVINTMVNIRGMSQHTLLEAAAAADEVRGTRTILTSRLVRFFMCNENFHLEHHLYPGVPWYHLPRVHAALGRRLAEMGAPYIPSYHAFVALFMRHSLARSPLRWKQRGRLVS
jgi:fatty acid desaturase